MTKVEILKRWTRYHGRLSEVSRFRFLRRRETARLTRYDDEVVDACLMQYNLLVDVLRCASDIDERGRGDGPPGPKDPSQPPKRPSGSGSTKRMPIRSRDKLIPTQPADTDLHRKIGPTQRYDDDF